MSSINDWCSRDENIQKLECINNKSSNNVIMQDQKITNTATDMTPLGSNLPYSNNDEMPIVIPIIIISLGVILLLGAIIYLIVRLTKGFKNINNDNINNDNINSSDNDKENNSTNSSDNNNSKLLLSLFTKSPKNLKNKPSQVEILTSSNIKQQDEESDGSYEEDSDDERKKGSVNEWEIISIREDERTEEGDLTNGHKTGTGNDNNNNDNSIVIGIDYDSNNDSSDMMNEIMSEINGKKYYKGIEVPPLGARIIPLERQMEISKELSEKQNYYQYYNGIEIPPLGARITQSNEISSK